MSNSNLIVTRHAGLVAWLNERGITGEVVAHATAETVNGRTVYGVLPLNLAAHARRVINVDMPAMSAEQRGKDLSPEEMDAAGACLSEYVVLRPEDVANLRLLAGSAEGMAGICNPGDSAWIADLLGRLGRVLA